MLTKSGEKGPSLRMLTEVTRSPPGEDGMTFIVEMCRSRAEELGAALTFAAPRSLIWAVLAGFSAVSGAE